MKGHKTFSLISLVALLLMTSLSARAELSTKPARKAITRMAGFELTNGAVRVRSIRETSPSSAEVTASIKSVFRFEKDSQGAWRVAEIRTKQDNWERIDLIARALGASEPTPDCNAPDPPARGKAVVDPSVKRTRCLLASLFGINLPSDAVRIQEVAPFAIPLASHPSTTVIAWIDVDARLVKQAKVGWQVSELRTGSNDWVRVDIVQAGVDSAKGEVARRELQTIADALERFRRERGSYLVADKQSVVIDHLSPRYLAHVIRLDPWRQAYNYQGFADRFTLSSAGPDRKESTADDIVLTGPVR